MTSSPTQLPTTPPRRGSRIVLAHSRFGEFVRGRRRRRYHRPWARRIQPGPTSITPITGITVRDLLSDSARWQRGLCSRGPRRRSGDARQYPSRLVREETAELASYALSDAASGVFDETVSARQDSSESEARSGSASATLKGAAGDEEHGPRLAPDRLLSTDIIHEVSEPVSPATQPSSQQPPPGTSVLTEMLRHSPPDEQKDLMRISLQDGRDRTWPRQDDSVDALGDEGAAMPTDERSALLPRSRSGRGETPCRVECGGRDLEGQRAILDPSRLGLQPVRQWWNEQILASVRTMTNPKHWDARTTWRKGVLTPASYAPAVVLGVLLNILDAVSYGTSTFKQELR